MIIAGSIIFLAILGFIGYLAMTPSPAVNNQYNNVPAVKTFTVTAQNFSFGPSEIRVKLGDTVKIILNNVGGFHDLVIDEFNARTEQAQGTSTKEVTFTADKIGTFEFYCSVGTHRQMGMVGKLIVE